MAQHAELAPNAFILEGGAVGCLLLHSFTGSPLEMRPLSEFLVARGFTVCVPLLAGHGTVPEDLARVSWRDWASSANEALVSLRARCEIVFVAGVSMGALLTLHLAAHHPMLSGIVLYSPALRLAQKGLYLSPLLQCLQKQWSKEINSQADLADPEGLRYLWSYATIPVHGICELLKLQHVVRVAMAGIHVPAIVFCSTRDRVLHPVTGKLTFAKLGSVDKELVTLHNSGHLMVVDGEREMIFAHTFGFLIAHAGDRL